MLRKLLFVLCFISLMAGASLAQARRTVTNSDLEKYREQRVVAEQALRDEYAKLGFPSPEERARRNVESQQQLLDLSKRLKAERLERERLELEREQLLLMNAPQLFPNVYNNAVQPGEIFYPTVWGSGIGGFGRGRFGRGFHGRQQHGYFAGGQFWPQGPRTALRPLMATPHPARVPHH